MHHVSNHWDENGNKACQHSASQQSPTEEGVMAADTLQQETEVNIKQKHKILLTLNIEDETNIEIMNIDVRPNGSLIARTQFEDYSLRGHELEQMSLLEFVTDTYEERISRSKRENAPTPKDLTGHNRGRPPNIRSPYLNTHQTHDTTT
jgi:hypothetical protein